MELIKQINNTNNYFISDLGYCFKTQKNQDTVIPLRIIQGVPKVKIKNKKLNLINLMIEHFIGEIDYFSKISYKIKNNKIPLELIKVRKCKKLSAEDEKGIFMYSCSKKASTSNNRVNHKNKIDKYDVLNSLKRTNFKCFYCGCKINSKLWHLDHVYPLSKGGLNIKTNITPSCKYCNLMKGDMNLDKFLFQCNKITKIIEAESGFFVQ